MPPTQDSPIEDGHDDATNQQELDGIVEQVRADVALGHTHGPVADLLRQRAREANVDVSEEQLAQLAAKMSGPE